MNLSRSFAAAAALAALAVPATAAAKSTESFFAPRGGEALVALTAAASCLLAVRAAELASPVQAAGRVWR
jgi:hypothetical protein